MFLSLSYTHTVRQRVEECGKTWWITVIKTECNRRTALSHLESTLTHSQSTMLTLFGRAVCKCTLSCRINCVVWMRWHVSRWTSMKFNSKAGGREERSVGYIYFETATTSLLLFTQKHDIFKKLDRLNPHSL